MNPTQKPKQPTDEEFIKFFLTIEVTPYTFKSDARSAIKKNFEYYNWDNGGDLNEQMKRIIPKLPEKYAKIYKQSHREREELKKLPDAMNSFLYGKRK